MTVKSEPLAWGKFLETSIGGKDTAEKLRVWMGQLLGSGPAPEKILVLTGDTAAGKSILLDILAFLTKESGMEVKTDFCEQATTLARGVACLKNFRLSISHQIDFSKASTRNSFSPINIKHLSNRDSALSRPKFERNPTFITVDCAFAWAILTELPEPYAEDLAIQARMLVIPMRKISLEERDLILFEKLKNEAQQIREWALQESNSG